MLIQQRRVRNLDRHLGFIEVGRPVVIGLSELDRHAQRLRQVGFPIPPELGTALLPPGLGPVSRFNAEGGWEIHKDRPKITDYRQIEWTWQQWRGRDRDEMREIRDVPFERYQRTRIPSPGVELAVVHAAVGAPAVVTPALDHTDANKADLRHRINLLLELFGECTVLTDDLEPLMRAPTRRLNWKLLPAGSRSLENLKRELKPVLDQMGKRTRPVAEHRLRELEQYEPDKTAVGQGGFTGYIAFEFPDRDLVVLENLHWGNATYVFHSDWEHLAQRTKTQILDENLHRARLIHTRGEWERQVRRLLRLER